MSSTKRRLKPHALHSFSSRKEQVQRNAYIIYPPRWHSATPYPANHPPPAEFLKNHRDEGENDEIFRGFIYYSNFKPEYSLHLNYEL